jgi:hypothetical protein
MGEENMRRREELKRLPHSVEFNTQDTVSFHEDIVFYEASNARSKSRKPDLSVSEGHVQKNKKLLKKNKISIEDGSGYQEFTYGRMGEVTEEFRTFALLFEQGPYLSV